jgi:hypothetical protein
MVLIWCARCVPVVSRRLSGRVGENAVFRSHVMRNLDALNAAVLDWRYDDKGGGDFPHSVSQPSAPGSHVYPPSCSILPYR